MMSLEQQAEAQNLLYRAEATIENLRNRITQMQPKIEMIQLIERLVYGEQRNGVSLGSSIEYDIKNLLHTLEKEQEARMAKEKERQASVAAQSVPQSVLLDPFHNTNRANPGGI